MGREGSSHRIGILDEKRVQLILDAPKMKDPSAVLVSFAVGKGLVVHAISHFHLQGSAKTGEYVSAYILTNVIDEAMRRRHPGLVASKIRVIGRSVVRVNKPRKPRIRVLGSR